MRYTGTLTLLTDLYELTMMQGYFFKDRNNRAVFEMFYRRQPFDGGFAVFAGLAPLLHELQNLRFSADDLSYLKSLGIFKDEFIGYLSGFSFLGSVHAPEEGTLVFPNEPLLRIEGTLMETQLVESMVLNSINFPTLIATKTARIVEAAQGRPVLEFGLRRAHGVDGALSATRASYIGGASSTSNTLAGKLFGMPVSGTMAHSWVMSFDSEFDSFREYAKLYPERCVLLVDTFDTLNSGVPNAIRVFSMMKSDGITGNLGIRIDSGDLGALSKRAREMLDSAGFPDVRIFVSSDMDEGSISLLLESGSPIDAWGVGTRMVTAWDDPALTGVYKIVARSNSSGNLEPCIKISDQTEKATNPGIKNIMRFYNEKNMMMGDLLYLVEEEKELLEKISGEKPVRIQRLTAGGNDMVITDYCSAKSLLKNMMKNGKICAPLPLLNEIRSHRENEFTSMGRQFRRLKKPDEYPVCLSDRLKKLKDELTVRMENSYTR